MSVAGPQDTMTASGRLPMRDVLLLVVLAGTSGAGIIAHTLGWISMRYSAPVLVVPSAVVLVGLVFARRGEAERVTIIGDRLLYGAVWGLIATFAYDLIRPPIVELLSLDFNPFKAMPIFGNLITGRPEDDGVARVVGWAYHFWNGIGFGMMFSLVRPRGRWLAGLVWGLGLQGFMMAIYPDFLQARLDDPGFMYTGLFGHAVWGVVLGWGLSWKGPRR